MGRRRRVQTRAVVSNAPSAEEIARLNAALREAETLARRVNDPWVGVIFSMLFLLLQQAVDRDQVLMAMDRFCRRWFDKTSAEMGWAFLPLFPMVGYMYYQLYRAVAGLVVRFFPNGVGYERRQHPAYDMRVRLGTSEEVRALTAQLKTLTESQRSWARRADVLGFVVSLLLPFLSQIQARDGVILMPSFSTGLVLTPFGLALQVSGPSVRQTVPTFVSVLSRHHQALYNTRRLWRWWTNWNTPGQLEKFAGRLKRISCLSQDWEVQYETAQEKVAAMAHLVFSRGGNKLRFCGKGGIHQDVSRTNYLTELHRVLLEAGIPVYLVTGEELYVGYEDLGERRCRRLRAQLQERLERVVKAENECEAVLKQLEGLLKLVQLPRDRLDYYLSIDSQGMPETYYYISMGALHRDNQDDLLEILEGIVPSGRLKVEGRVITLAHADIEREALQRAQASLEQRCQQRGMGRVPSWQVVGHQLAEHDEAAETVRRRAPKRRDDVAAGKAALPEAGKPTPALSINFGRGVQFFPLTEDPRPPRNYAFPLDIPWLPEGRAYASIDPAAIEAVRAYTTEAAILARLTRGKVHGSRATASQDKSGSVGIQTTRESYTDCHGENRMAAFKLKFDNNVRISGYRLGEVRGPDGNRYVHYRFNGPGFGH